jgi:sugar lactone lactonase YvrE
MVLGPDGALYVTEAAGNVQRIDLASGAKKLVADKLLLPEGLAFTPWGSLIVAEAAARRLTEIDRPPAPAAQWPRTCPSTWKPVRGCRRPTS